jgi:hypothetical protein
VEINFDPAALTEVGFRRNAQREWEVADFTEEYELVGVEEVTAEATHLVQDTAERAMLDLLEERVRQIHDALEEGSLLSVESQPGGDHPRTRYDRTTKGEREFTYSLDRPLKVGIWVRKGS